MIYTYRLLYWVTNWSRASELILPISRPNGHFYLLTRDWAAPGLTPPQRRWMTQDESHIIIYAHRNLKTVSHAQGFDSTSTDSISDNKIIINRHCQWQPALTTDTQWHDIGTTNPALTWHRHRTLTLTLTHTNTHTHIHWTHTHTHSDTTVLCPVD